MFATKIFVIASAIMFVYGCPPTSKQSSVVEEKSCKNTNVLYSSSSSSSGWVETEVCKAYGFTLRQNIPSFLWDDLQAAYYKVQCELIDSISSYYPTDIAYLLPQLSESERCYDVVILGAEGGALGSILPLLEAGKKVLLLSEGSYSPFQSRSIYNRVSLYESDQYVKKYSLEVTNFGIKKNLYVSTSLGGSSCLDSNTFELPDESYFSDLASVADIWSFNNLQSVYKEYSSYEKTEKKKTREECTKVERTPCGGLSITSSVSESEESTTIKSACTELGYSSSVYSPNSLQPGLCTIPRLGEENKNVVLAEEILKLASKYDNLKIALSIVVKKVVFKENRAVGVIIVTSESKEVYISASDYVIFGSNAITTSRLLLASGVGHPTSLKNCGVTPIAPLPHCGQGISFSSYYNGLVLKFPKGSLVPASCVSRDTYGWLTGQNTFSTYSALENYKLYLKSQHGSTVDVAATFHAYSSSVYTTFQHAIKYVYQYDSSVQETLLKEITQYDILIISLELLSDKSRGTVVFTGSDYTPVIRTTLFEEETDVLVLSDAINQVIKFTSTKVFTDIGCQPVPLPFSCQAPQYSPEWIRSSIQYASAPGLYFSSGLKIGKSAEDSVLDKYCRIHGLKNVVYYGSGIYSGSNAVQSIASSFVVGKYGASLLIQNYDSLLQESSISSVSLSESVQKSSKSESRQQKSRNVNNIGGLNSYSYDSASQEAEKYASSHSASSYNSGGLNGLASSYSQSSEESSQEESSRSASSYNSGVLGLGNGVASSYSQSAEESSQEESSYSASNYNSGGLGSGIASSYSEFAQEESQEESSRSASSYNSGGLGGVQSSDYEYEASESGQSSEKSQSAFSGNGISQFSEESSECAHKKDKHQKQSSCGCL